MRDTSPDNERGASGISVILILVFVLMIAELIIMGGRLAAANAQVANAAREAARTGSLSATAGSFETRTRDAAADTLADQSTKCVDTPEVSIVGSNFDRSGNVTATVFCTVDLSDLSLLKLPFLPDIEVSSEHTEIIETFRVVE